jgi:hypothetical protein
MSSSWQTTRRWLKWCCCLIAVFPVIWEMCPLSTIQNLSSEKAFLFSRLGEGDQPSVETGGGGVFTSLVVDALEGGAANLLGAVSAPAIYAFVEAALGAWDRHSAFSYLTPPIPRRLFTALCEPKTIALLSVSMDQIIGLTVGSNGRRSPKIRNITLVWSLDVPDVGADRMLSIEDMVWNSQRTLVSATVGRTLGQSQGAARQVRTRGCGLWNDLKPSPLQRYFWVRNAPYALRDPCNPLKSQQMSVPSERTKRVSH